MGDPELMGSPSRVTLLGALQSWYLSLQEGMEKGGDSCFHGRPWAKKRVWRGDLAVLWTRTVHVAARFCHQGGENRGNSFLLHFLHTSCSVDAGFVYVKWGRAPVSV